MNNRKRFLLSSDFGICEPDDGLRMTLFRTRLRLFPNGKYFFYERDWVAIQNLNIQYNIGVTFFNYDYPHTYTQYCTWMECDLPNAAMVRFRFNFPYFTGHEEDSPNLIKEFYLCDHTGSIKLEMN